MELFIILFLREQVFKETWELFLTNSETHGYKMHTV